MKCERWKRKAVWGKEWLSDEEAVGLLEDENNVWKWFGLAEKIRKEWRERSMI